MGHTWRRGGSAVVRSLVPRSSRNSRSSEVISIDMYSIPWIAEEVVGDMASLTSSLGDMA